VSEPKTRPTYQETAAIAVALIAIAVEHADKEHRADIVNEAASMFWHAAQADAYRRVRRGLPNTIRDGDPEEVMALSKAALRNLSLLEQAADRCGLLSDLIKIPEDANVKI